MAGSATRRGAGTSFRATSGASSCVLRAGGRSGWCSRGTARGRGGGGAAPRARGGPDRGAFGREAGAAGAREGRRGGGGRAVPLLRHGAVGPWRPVVLHQG